MFSRARASASLPPRVFDCCLALFFGLPELGAFEMDLTRLQRSRLLLAGKPPRSRQDCLRHQSYQVQPAHAAAL